MKRPLRDVAKDQFTEQDLSPSKIAEIEQLMEHYAPPKSHSNKLRYVIPTLAACVVLLSLTYFVHGLLFNRYINVSEAIASEVARNHIKMKPLEVSTHLLPEARRFFNNLDFSITGSSMVANELLQGGRYCSIQGVTAAQLRYEDQNGDQLTLYEVEYDPRIFGKQPNIDQGMEPDTLLLKGLEVRIWVEKGLLMVLAKDTIP